LTIRRGMDWISNGTCIKFRQAKGNDKFYVYIMWQASACNSYVGMMPKEHQPQVVHLARKGCMFPGTVAHELLHAVGLDHQHNTMNRDDYIKIHWDNIADGKRFFSKRQLILSQNNDN